MCIRDRLERLKKAWQYAPNQAAMEELLAKGRTEQTLFTIDGQAYTDVYKRQDTHRFVQTLQVKPINTLNRSAPFFE